MSESLSGSFRAAKRGLVSGGMPAVLGLTGHPWLAAAIGSAHLVCWFARPLLVLYRRALTERLAARLGIAVKDNDEI